MKNYASFGKRFLAVIIDGFVVTAIGYVFMYLFGYLPYIAFSWLIGGLYFILSEGSSANATLGKKAVGIVVTDINGNPIGYGTAAIRYFGKIVSAMILMIGYIMAAFSDTSQAMHDKMAGTLVLNGYPSSCQAHTPGASYSYHAHLIGIAGEFAGMSFPIDSNGIMLGRDNVACQIIFTNQAKGVSRHHCVIKYNPDSKMFVINDIGSSYGTFLANGTKIGSTPTAMRSGERFYLGSQSNMFEVK